MTWEPRQANAVLFQGKPGPKRSGVYCRLRLASRIERMTYMFEEESFCEEARKRKTSHKEKRVLRMCHIKSWSLTLHGPSACHAPTMSLVTPIPSLFSLNKLQPTLLTTRVRTVVSPCLGVFLCFMKLILGNCYGPGVSLRASQGGTHPGPQLRIADVPPHPILP